MRDCYKCGENDHFPRECPNVSGGGRSDKEPELTCFNCDRAGHCSRDCKEPRPFSGQRFGGSCFNCGESGHMSRDCTSKRR